MRRQIILVLIAATLGVLFGTSSVAAAEGDPGDYCSYSPDYPFGWNFNDACREHDACLDDLPATASLEDRLACDEGFLEGLLDASHLSLPVACNESLFCRWLATVYYRVVRYATLFFGGAFDSLGRLGPWHGSTALPAP